MSEENDEEKAPTMFCWFINELVGLGYEYCEYVDTQ